MKNVKKTYILQFHHLLQHQKKKISYSSMLLHFFSELNVGEHKNLINGKTLYVKTLLRNIQWVELVTIWLKNVIEFVLTVVTVCGEKSVKICNGINSKVFFLVIWCIIMNICPQKSCSTRTKWHKMKKQMRSGFIHCWNLDISKKHH